MQLLFRIITVIVFSSCYSNSINTDSSNSQESLSLKNDSLSFPSVDTTQPSSSVVYTNRSEKKIKAIENIYFGIPSSENFASSNKEVMLGECTFKVMYPKYNEYPLGENFVSGLYSFSMVSQGRCTNLEYIVRLFSSKYGTPEIISKIENHALPDVTNIHEIEVLDNSMTALFYGSMPGVINQQQAPVFITDENTVYPVTRLVEEKVYKWDTDSISIELKHEYKFSPVGSGKTFEYKGAKSGGKFHCEYVESFSLQSTFTIDFVNRPTELAVKKYSKSKDEEAEKSKFKMDQEKL